MLAPWKTASMTLHARLAAYDESPYDRMFHFSPRLNRVVHQHMTCADFQSYPEAGAGFLVGSFVRNPYDRAYSGFQQLQSDIETMPGLTFAEPWIAELVQAQLAENWLQLFRAGFAFDPWMESVTEAQVREVGRNSNFPLHPAHYWTHVAGAPFAGFVGRVETFEADFAQFCNRAGIELPEPVNVNVRAAPGSRYAERMGRRAIDRINALFHDDFELFGYERL